MGVLQLLTLAACIVADWTIGAPPASRVETSGSSRCQAFLNFRPCHLALKLKNCLPLASAFAAYAQTPCSSDRDDSSLNADGGGNSCSFYQGYGCDISYGTLTGAQLKEACPYSCGVCSVRRSYVCICVPWAYNPGLHRGRSHDDLIPGAPNAW